MRAARSAFLALALAATAWPGFGRLRDGRAVHVASARAEQEQEWKKEFEVVCSRTQDAMALGREELSSLVLRCDRLMPILDKLEESQRKVYSKRLRACRDLYQFVLDSPDGG